MDYKFTFQDGSEAMAHYGVQGMKWGKWNAETQTRYANAGNSTYFKKASRGSEYGKAVTDQRRAYNANQPKSKQIAKTLLLGPGGAHAYNTSRSRGLGRSESFRNSMAGVLYAQGVKHKQKKLGTTESMVSKAAKERGDYTKNESFKKSVAKTVLAGGQGAVVYDSVKSRTKSRGKALLATAGVTIATGVGAGLLGEVGTTAAIAGSSALLRRNGYKQQTKASNFDTRTPETKRNGKQRR